MIDRPLSSGAAASVTRSVTELLHDTATHTENIVRGEIRLAVVRAQHAMVARVRFVGLMMLGGTLGVVAFVVLLVAGIMRLAEIMAPWMATGIAGLATALLAVSVMFASTRLHGDAT